MLCVVSSAERPTAMAEARQIVLGNPQVTRIARFSNLLIQLDRYEDMKAFCLELLSLLDLHGNLESVVQAKRDMAIACASLGDTAGAERWYQEALALDCDDEDLLSAYAGFLRSSRKYADALSCYQQLIEIDPLDSRYYIFAGETLEKLGRHEAAIRVYTRAATLGLDDSLLGEGGFEKRALKAGLRRDSGTLFDDSEPDPPPSHPAKPLSKSQEARAGGGAG